MKQQTSSKISWYNRRDGALIICLVSGGLAYAVGSRAIDTGSLQQYVITFGLVVAAGNRLLAATTAYQGSLRKPRKEQVHE